MSRVGANNHGWLWRALVWAVRTGAYMAVGQAFTNKVIQIFADGPYADAERYPPPWDKPASPRAHDAPRRVGATRPRAPARYLRSVTTYFLG